ncbi:MAG TPA: cytochrome c oxidase assembly protein [Anaerolineae bacterium]|nr:cytochrome c oxidase assembly protein [Anaerolineae bacterium]
MDESTRAFLFSWEWRVTVWLPLLVFGILFTRGWLRLRRLPTQKGQPSVHLATIWRLISYWLGLFLLALALLSPIDSLGGQLFTMHMVQHLLLGMYAPPLLLVTNPLPILMWGLPLGISRPIGRIVFSRSSKIRPYITAITTPFFVWLLFLVVLWGWHDSAFYNLALRSERIHDLEHLSFFISAMLLWWHITGSGPRFHKRMSDTVRLIFTAGCLPVNMILGIALALSDGVIYTYYETLPFRLWGLSVLADQQMGGAIMWVFGSMMYVIAILVLIGQGLQREGR